jgi:hypothetical protein
MGWTPVEDREKRHHNHSTTKKRLQVRPFLPFVRDGIRLPALSSQPVRLRV